MMSTPANLQIERPSLGPKPSGPRKSNRRGIEDRFAKAAKHLGRTVEELYSELDLISPDEKSTRIGDIRFSFNKHHGWNPNVSDLQKLSLFQPRQFGRRSAMAPDQTAEVNKPVYEYGDEIANIAEGTFNLSSFQDKIEDNNPVTVVGFNMFGEIMRATGNAEVIDRNSKFSCIDVGGIYIYPKHGNITITKA